MPDPGRLDALALESSTSLELTRDFFKAWGVNMSFGMTIRSVRFRLGVLLMLNPGGGDIEVEGLGLRFGSKVGPEGAAESMTLAW